MFEYRVDVWYTSIPVVMHVQCISKVSRLQVYKVNVQGVELQLPKLYQAAAAEAPLLHGRAVPRAPCVCVHSLLPSAFALRETCAFPLFSSFSQPAKHAKEGVFGCKYNRSQTKGTTVVC